ncbi:Bifunctional protein FolD protein [Candidatus Hepatoplasma crinochetorum Av]|uniref:Bifunctional protein FolD n=1 Tax=Candidatus Hepatoplasma crinochetorum Av TaxID=1427984 RepID=W8GMD1_9MOLU|nr:bifunctional 5,10-methylenetetrahydrofolate dehydrogenase/5,10-methenyltetrahydrofolate cyclohydrolase [Candidatus Hepatoplasma crinochetorum]AHK22176.1 Bifunctional protein FolD protein [Candidatus Hepatoplasma crinochetorum Av]
MNGKILEGNKLADKLLNDLKETIIKDKLNLKLVAIQVGSVEESNLYLDLKKIQAKNVGINFEIIKLSENIENYDLIKNIEKLNKDKTVDGIIIQLPLPKKIDLKLISQAIVPWKDVDGFNPFIKGQLDLNQLELVPPTAMATFYLLENNNISFENKSILVIGRGEIAGKPIIKMLLNKNAIVTSVGNKIKDLKKYTKKADIIISATGDKNIINNRKMVKKNVGLVNIGLVKEDGKIIGDINEEKLIKKASWIIPAKGGIGPLTVAFLLINTYKCYIIRKNSN